MLWGLLSKYVPNRPLLINSTATTLARATITSHLEYYYSFLTGPAASTQPTTNIPSTAAKEIPVHVSQITSLFCSKSSDGSHTTES